MSDKLIQLLETKSINSENRLINALSEITRINSHAYRDIIFYMILSFTIIAIFSISSIYDYIMSNSKEKFVKYYPKNNRYLKNNNNKFLLKYHY